MAAQTAKLERPSWEEWKAMHWRERSRYRRAGVEPPAPPLQVFLALSEAERAELGKLDGTPSDAATLIIRRSLSRRNRSKQNGSSQNSRNGRRRKASR